MIHSDQHQEKEKNTVSSDWGSTHVTDWVAGSNYQPQPNNQQKKINKNLTATEVNELRIQNNIAISPLTAEAIKDIT